MARSGTRRPCRARSGVERWNWRQGVPLGHGQLVEAVQHRRAQQVQPGEGQLHLRLHARHTHHLAVRGVQDQVVQSTRSCPRLGRPASLAPGCLRCGRRREAGRVHRVRCSGPSDARASGPADRMAPPLGPELCRALDGRPRSMRLGDALPPGRRVDPARALISVHRASQILGWPTRRRRRQRTSGAPNNVARSRVVMKRVPPPDPGTCPYQV